eukprot:CAMPEP_0171058294 /NCGR_PEP_ID=MMETSP0766_2-20121228/2414_1 /TAXON_ID=439317 /ORGANISM="Gambierdiscus australes, Strain CAWD 149" /LENGTH=111 /DNA_ID=CAMNT_0011513555 /DNA_START=897 /DNA_END=1232 /DNA_ORIENTATION=-
MKLGKQAPVRGEMSHSGMGRRGHGATGLSSTCVPSQVMKPGVTRPTPAASNVALTSSWCSVPAGGSPLRASVVTSNCCTSIMSSIEGTAETSIPSPPISSCGSSSSNSSGM